MIRFLCLAVFPAALFAETIFLRNGQYITGQIITQTVDDVQVQTSEGLRTIRKSSIRRIVHNAPRADEDKKREEKEKAEKLAREEEAREQERIAREQWQAELVREQERQDRERAAEIRRRAEAEWRAQAEKRRREALISDNAARALQASWRSALVPGWGQHYLGQDDRGKFVFSAAFATFGLTYLQYLDYQKKHANYKDEVAVQRVSLVVTDSLFPAVFTYTGTRTTAAREAMRKAGTRTNQLLAGLLLLWTWNILDAASAGLSTGGAPAGVRFGFTMRF